MYVSWYNSLDLGDISATDAVTSHSLSVVRPLVSASIALPAALLNSIISFISKVTLCAWSVRLCLLCVHVYTCTCREVCWWLCVHCWNDVICLVFFDLIFNCVCFAYMSLFPPCNTSSDCRLCEILFEIFLNTWIFLTIFEQEIRKWLISFYVL